MFTLDSVLNVQNAETSSIEKIRDIVASIFTTSVVKSSTGTYTAEEQLELMSRGGGYTKPIMKKVVPNVFNQGEGMKHAISFEPTVQPPLKVQRRKEDNPPTNRGDGQDRPLNLTIQLDNPLPSSKSVDTPPLCGNLALTTIGTSSDQIP